MSCNKLTFLGQNKIVTIGLKPAENNQQPWLDEPLVGNKKVSSQIATLLVEKYFKQRKKYLTQIQVSVKTELSHL